MLIGFDTGFFLELMRGNPLARKAWLSIETDNIGLASCLTLFELERLGLKRAIKNHQALIQSLTEACKIIWPNLSILSMAARLSHGLGIPGMDSIILASLLEAEVETIWTTDQHFELYKKKKVKIQKLKLFGS